MHVIAICIYAMICLSVSNLFLFVTIAIAFLEWFVLLVLNIIHVLNLESICLIPHIHITLYNVLLLTCSISYLWIYGTLTPLNRVLLEKLKGPHPEKKFPIFNDMPGSSPNPQVPATSSYPQADQSSP